MNIQKTKNFFRKTAAQVVFFIALSFGSGATAQTNVYDDIIAQSPAHTYLKAAIDQQGLQAALRDSAANLTVFAPTNAAFDALATALNTNIAGLLALPNLTDVLTYHVLGITVPSDSIRNGQLVTPLNAANTLKLTKTGMGDVFVNQAKVSAANLSADNGLVHVLDAVVLPNKTVVDIALGDQTNFSVLTAAVIQAELLPALSNPLATLTVFAPTNAAFAKALTALDITAEELLGSPELSAILTYHVLGSTVPSDSIRNGQLVTPLNAANTLKLTKTGMGDVFVNQAKVTSANVAADNGLVHVLDAVVLPVETVVDVALDNNFTTLAAAAIKAELLPALSDPFALLTVFAPDNAAFDTLAMMLNTDLNGLLALPNLKDVLLYHVLNDEVLSSELSAGTVNALNGKVLTVKTSPKVMINDADVTTADVPADNGVVHVINKVLIPASTSVKTLTARALRVYPNPAATALQINGFETAAYEIVNVYGAVVMRGNLDNGSIDISNLANGNYMVKISAADALYSAGFIKL